LTSLIAGILLKTSAWRSYLRDMAGGLIDFELGMHILY